MDGTGREREKEGRREWEKKGGKERKGERGRERERERERGEREREREKRKREREGERDREREALLWEADELISGLIGTRHLDCRFTLDHVVQFSGARTCSVW